MVDPGTIIALLAGGAIAKLDGLGGQAVTDAYAGLKTILTDVYGFTTDRLLEKKPKDETARKAAEEDIAAEATQDPQVEAKVRALEEALATIPEQKWREAGVLIEGLTARQNVEMGNVTAGQRGVTIRQIRSEEADIRIGDISG